MGAGFGRMGAVGGGAGSPPKLFVFAGQSNMRGTVGLADVPVHLQTADSGIKIWTGAAFETMEVGVNSGNNNGDGTAENWGPEAEFAYQHRQANPGETIYIVKVAQGGTGLALDGGGADWNVASASDLWDDLTGHVAAALAAVTDLYVAAMFWFQGEADAKIEADANAYADNLDDLVTAARSEFSAPDMKFIAGRIHDTLPIGTYPYKATVRSAQQAFQSTSECYTIDTDSFSIGGDNVHFTATGFVSVGDSFYTTYATDAVLPSDPSVYGLDALTDKYGIYSPAARVLTAYSPTGNLLRLRRSTDDVEADFAADAVTGLLDTAAVTTWLGGGTGYITTLYDQSGNGYDAAQATAASQASLNLVGSLPCADFDGSDDTYSIAGAVGFARNVGQASLLAVCKYDSSAVTDTVMGVANNGASARMVLQKTSTVFRCGGRRQDADSVVNTTGLTGNLNWVVQMAAFDFTNSDLYHRVDSSTETLTTFQTDGVTSDTDSTGVVLGRQPYTNNMDGQVSLWVLTRDLLNGTTGSNLAASLAALKVT